MEVKKVQVDSKEVKKMQEVMKIWSTGKVAENKEQAAAPRISKIKNRIFHLNQLHAE